MHAGGALNALDDAGCQRADGRLVNQVPAIVELRLPVVGAIGVAEGRPVGIWLGQHVHARHGRTIALAAIVVLRSECLRSDAVPAATKGDNLKLARVHFGHFHGRLVALAAGAEKESLVKAGREQIAETAAEGDHRRRDHAGKEVVQFGGMSANDLDNLGVAVAEEAGHLARCKVEHLVAVCRVHIEAAAANDDILVEFGTVVGKVLACLLHQLVLFDACVNCRCGHGGMDRLRVVRWFGDRRDFNDSTSL